MLNDSIYRAYNADTIYVHENNLYSMQIQDEILLNQYAQDIYPLEFLENKFNLLEVGTQRDFLGNLLNLLLQSKPVDADIDYAILHSGLKNTYTPCVLLKKGLSSDI